jgi:Resolvase, N terminal domain
MKRAVLYLRVSTIDQTAANQERELREIAGRIGYEVTRVYKDRGLSGAKGRFSSRSAAALRQNDLANRRPPMPSLAITRGDTIATGCSRCRLQRSLRICQDRHADALFSPVVILRGRRAAGGGRAWARNGLRWRRAAPACDGGCA